MPIRKRTVEDAGASTGFYTIQKGDNLTKIAKRYNTTVDNLAKLNNIKDVNTIYAGNQLRLADTIEKTRTYVAGHHETPKSTQTPAQRDSARKAWYRGEVDKKIRLRRAADSVATENVTKAITAAKNRYNIPAAPKAATNSLTGEKSIKTVTGNGRVFEEQTDNNSYAEVFGRHITPVGKSQTPEERKDTLRKYVESEKKLIL